MEKIFRFFYRCVVLFFVTTCLIDSVAHAQAVATTKNGTPQGPNYDFEVWDNASKPWGWNGVSESYTAPASSGLNLAACISRSTEIRPGSKGQYSAQITVTNSSFTFYKKWFGLLGTTEKASFSLGTMTTGQIFLWGNPDEKNVNSSYTCVWSRTSEESKHWPFQGTPDSLVVWVKSVQGDARMKVRLHGDCMLQDYPSGIFRKGNMDDYNYVLSGTTPPQNAISEGDVLEAVDYRIPYNGGEWQRVSIPLNCSAKPSNALITFHAGENGLLFPVSGDQLFVDDMMFIYNPTLRIADEMKTEIGHHGHDSVRFDIPFTITGTMSPFNNLPDNEVIAWLSDADGNFDNAIEVARVTTDESGTLQVRLPADFPDSDNYLLKLESTNYPLESNIVKLSIYKQWYLTIASNSPLGSVSPEMNADLVRHGSNLKAKATPNPDCAFLRWEENGLPVSEEAEYAFQHDRDRNLLAVFDTTYTLEFAPVTGATVYFANNRAMKITLVNGDTAKMRTEVDYGYCFNGYELNEVVYSEDSLAFDYIVRQGGTVYPLIDSISYDYLFTVYPDPKLGSATGSGKHKHFSDVQAVATPANPYSHFKHWEDTSGQIVSMDTLWLLESIEAGGVYRAVFEEEFHTVSLSVNDSLKGKALQGEEEKTDSLYSAFDRTRISIRAVPATGYAFRYWEVRKDGIGQSAQTDNPYYVTDSSHLDADYLFTAVFDTSVHRIDLTAEHGRVSGQGTYKYGQVILLTARPDEGYHFKAWTDGNGLELGREDSLRLQVFSDSTLTAVFEINTYRVDIQSNDTTLGRVRPESGEYAHFTSLHLESVPEAWAELRYWVIDGDTLSTAPVYDMEITAPCRIQAVYSYYRPVVRVYANNESYGMAIGSGRYEWGDRVELKAESFYGYRFDYWEDPAGNRITENPIRIDSIVGDTTVTAQFSPKPFQVRLEVVGNGQAFIGNPDNGQHQAEVPYMNSVEITALADPDHDFDGWYDRNDNLLSRYMTENFFVERDTVLRAVFVSKQYSVNLFASPVGAGTLIGEGRYTASGSVDITAEAMSGYEFEGWYENGMLVTSEADYRIDRLDEDRYIVARFKEKEYTLQVEARPAEYASLLSGDGSYRYAYNARLFARPAEGYEFAAWVDSEGDTVSRQNPCLYDVQREDNLVALLRPARLQAAWRIVPAAAGAVSSGEIRYGQEAQATAVPAYGYRFERWQDSLGNEISPNSDLNFIARTDTLFTAVFAPLEYSVQAEAEAGRGSVSGGGFYAYRTECTLTVTPDTYYRFRGWFDENDVLLSLQPEWTITVTSDLNCQARFESVGIESALAVTPEYGGRIYFDNRQIGRVLQTAYHASVELEAVAEPGMSFREWRIEKDGFTERELNKKVVFRPEGGEMITAVFDTLRHNIVLAGEPALGGTVEGSGEYRHGQTVNLCGRASENYRFEAWRIADKIVSYDSAYSFVADSSVEIQALFIPRQYALTVLSADPQAGQAAGSGIYTYDTTLNLNAWNWNSGSRFSHWSKRADGSEPLGSEPVLAYRIEKNDTVYAHFEPAEFRVDLSVAEGKGLVEGEGLYPCGSMASLSARPAAGYHFVHWLEYGLPVGDDASLTVQIGSERAFEAVFAADTVSLELRLRDPELQVVLSGEGRYCSGASVNVMPGICPQGYRFTAWVDESDSVVSTQAAFVYTITRDTRLYAVWTPEVYTVETVVEGFGTASGGSACRWGDTVCLTACAEAGYVFSQWQRNGIFVSDKDTLRIEVYQNLRLVAVFEEANYEIHPDVNLAEGGFINTSGESDMAQPVGLHAIAREDYRFLYWSSGDSIVSFRSDIEVPRSEASSLLAHFEAESYSVRLQAVRPEGVAALRGAGTFKAGEAATLKITLRDGYVFKGWYTWENGQRVLLSDEPEFTLPVRRSMAVEAEVAGIE